jgi:glycerol uptake operon antiterminator
VVDHGFQEAEIRGIVREWEQGMGIAELCAKHGIEEAALRQWKRQYGSESNDEPGRQKLEEENSNLKQMVAELMLEKKALLQHRVLYQESQGAGDYCGVGDAEPEAAAVAPCEEKAGAAPVQVTVPATGHGAGYREPEAHPAQVQAVSGSGPVLHENVRSLLEHSRIIPAIRSSEFIPAAMASPGLVVWLLYGSPLTICEVVRKLRSAGKLPIANLDLLTGFAQDSDAVSLLVKLGVAGIVSTRQSALRAAHAQGIIAVQRTFAVDSIALHNITRALHHFVPDAIELLPAVAAPLAMPSLKAAKPGLPVIATGLVNSLRQVEELVRHGIVSVATSNTSLWIL